MKKVYIKPNIESIDAIGDVMMQCISQEDNWAEGKKYGPSHFENWEEDEVKEYKNPNVWDD